MNVRGAEAEIGLKIFANHFCIPRLNEKGITVPWGGTLVAKGLEQQGVTVCSIGNEWKDLLLVQGLD